MNQNPPIPGRARAVGLAALVVAALLVGAIVAGGDEGPSPSAGSSSPASPPPASDAAQPPGALPGGVTVDPERPAPSPVEGGYALTAEVISGQPCAGGQVLVQATLSPEVAGAVITIGKKRGALQVVDLPRRRGAAADAAGAGSATGGGASATRGGESLTIPVGAKQGGEQLASYDLVLPLAPCPGRLVADVRRVGTQQIRVRVSLLGTADDDAWLRYDFGQGDTDVTRDRDVTFDYGPDAEGQRFVITVSTVTAPDVAGSPSTAPAGMVGYGVVTFPRLDALRDLEAELDARQRKQNELAEQLGIDNR